MCAEGRGEKREGSWMESIRGMMIDIPVVETDTEASLEKAKADRDPPHPHTSPR